MGVRVSDVGLQRAAPRTLRLGLGLGLGLGFGFGLGVGSGLVGLQRAAARTLRTLLAGAALVVLLGGGG